MVGDRPPRFATLAVHGGGADGVITADMIEQRVALLEGGSASVAVAAGAPLFAAALQPLLRPGDQVIIARQGARHALADVEQRFSAFGWEVRWGEIDEHASFERAVSPKTQAILIASVAASGEVADIAALAAIAKRAQAPLIVDNAIATPALCRPLDHGGDIVVHSDPRYLCGENGVAGFIVDGGRFNWLGSRRYPMLSEKRAAHGGTSLAEAVGNFAYATACGEFVGTRPAVSGADRIAAALETLPLRMARHADNARIVADHLASHKNTVSVAYAGLAGDRHHALAQKYCADGVGPLVAFAVEGGDDAADALLKALTLIMPTRHSAPAKSSVVRGMSGARSGMLSLAVGLEDPADIIADLEQGLAAI